MEEWQEHWRNKSRRTSPGASGVGPDLWKEAPVWIQEMARRMYSACMKLKIMPDQWRVEIICPVSKSGSPVCRTEDLRPIKLLEVSKKCVMKIIKERLREVLEDSGILDEAQHGFRPGRGTQSAAVQVMAIYERAERNRQPITGIFLDIKKAYDSVERGAGKAMALRRLGVDEGTVEFFMHVDRGNINWVRTGWEAMREAEGRGQPCFEARRGVAQGAAESPLLWIIFFDMILTQLRSEGVGASTVTSTSDGRLTGHGLVAFADDTAFFEATTELAQRSADIVVEVLALMCLKIATPKSIQMSLIWVSLNGQPSRKVASEFSEAENIKMSGEAVPVAEHDEGLRYLGYWIDAVSDWGNQVIHLQEKARRFRAAVEPAKLTPREVMYLYNAVLVPRITYCLTVAAPGVDDIDGLESSTWAWMAKKIGLAPTQCRDLLLTRTPRTGWSRSGIMALGRLT